MRRQFCHVRLGLRGEGLCRVRGWFASRRLQGLILGQVHSCAGTGDSLADALSSSNDGDGNCYESDHNSKSR